MAKVTKKDLATLQKNVDSFMKDANKAGGFFIIAIADDTEGHTVGFCMKNNLGNSDTANALADIPGEILIEALSKQAVKEAFGANNKKSKAK